MAYLLSGGVDIFTSTPPGFVNGLWWSREEVNIAVNDLMLPVLDSCPSDMQFVEGMMLDDGGLGSWDSRSVEFLQRTTCTSWIEKKYPERCATFDENNWAKLRASFPTKPMSFCVDRYEWPNKKGSYPWVMITWTEALNLCWSVGKRLCTEEEWTFACEGEDATPYPYGYSRDSDKCNLDNRWRQYSSQSLAARGSEKCAVELKRLWQGLRSGALPHCASSFGVEDMNGSVDEWTIRGRIEGKYPSILKGGYWGPVRTRCRPSTRSHGPGHTFYQQGFRCCKNSSVVEGRQP